MGLFRNDEGVLVCPKCGSTQKEFAGSMPLNHVGGSGFSGKPLTPAFYTCKKCKYEGIFVLIDKTEIDSYKEDLKKEE
jgi:hypothetical protein